MYYLAGVLSFFALQAGASKVYAIEASNMAAHCQKLVKDNHYSKKMTVITGKVEEVSTVGLRIENWKEVGSADCRRIDNNIDCSHFHVQFYVN